jgi:hypothetical protein
MKMKIYLPEEELKIRNKQIQSKENTKKNLYPLFYVSNIILPNKLGENVNASVGMHIKNQRMEMVHF